MKILACIPAYNEESQIGRVAAASREFVDEVIVYDDGSTDGTADAARDAGATVISDKQNRGYGHAIATLLEHARQCSADIMVTIDGDGQHDPHQIQLLVDAMTRHNVDVVIGSRFLSSSGDIPQYRRHGIKIITSASNLGSDIKVSDSQSGFRAYSKKAIASIRPAESGMSVSTEILSGISGAGLSLAEVPITVSYSGETSTHNPTSHGMSVLASTLKYTSIRHPLPFYGIPGICFLVAGLVISGTFLDAYLTQEIVFFGSLLAGVILVILGAILCVTAIMLFSMANLFRNRY